MAYTNRFLQNDGKMRAKDISSYIVKGLTILFVTCFTNVSAWSKEFVFELDQYHYFKGKPECFFPNNRIVVNTDTKTIKLSYNDGSGHTNKYVGFLLLQKSIILTEKAITDQQSFSIDNLRNGVYGNQYIFYDEPFDDSMIFISIEKKGSSIMDSYYRARDISAYKRTLNEMEVCLFGNEEEGGSTMVAKDRRENQTLGNNLKTFAIENNRALQVSQMVYRPLFVLPAEIKNITTEEVVNHLNSYPGWKWSKYGSPSSEQGETIVLSNKGDNNYDMQYKGITPKTGIWIKNGHIEQYDWSITFTQPNQALNLYNEIISLLKRNGAVYKGTEINKSTVKSVVYRDKKRSFTISWFIDGNKESVDFASKYL